MLSKEGAGRNETSSLPPRMELHDNYPVISTPGHFFWFMEIIFPGMWKTIKSSFITVTTDYITVGADAENILRAAVPC